MKTTFKSPKFQYIPHMPHHDGIKVVYSTVINAYWQVFEFKDEQEKAEFILENENKLKESGYFSINFHKKYPFMLACIDAGSVDTTENLVKFGNQASDWYAEHWFIAQRDIKIRKNLDYSHFYICENRVSKEREGQEAVLKLSFPQVIIIYRIEDAFFASYEEFYSRIASVQWLDTPPPLEDQKEILRYAWNYLCEEEKNLEDWQQNNDNY